MKVARDTIKSREDNVLNFLINRSNNAAAKLLYSNLKSLRTQLRGVSDLPFFMVNLTWMLASAHIFPTEQAFRRDMEKKQDAIPWQHPVLMELHHYVRGNGPKALWG